MVKTLIKNDGKDYSGKFVATGTFNDNVVIAFGEDPSKVMEQAIQMGYDSPVIVFIPKKNTTYLL